MASSESSGVFPTKHRYPKSCGPWRAGVRAWRLSDRKRDGSQPSELRYYSSSLPAGVRRFAEAVRSHRGIGNSLHSTLDVMFPGDESRFRDRLQGEPRRSAAAG